MKVAPVSADLLIELAAAGLAIGVLWYIWRKAGSAAGDVLNAAGEVADQIVTGVNPASSQNVVNRAVSSIGAAVTTDTAPGKNADGSWSLGGAAYDLTHADPVTGKWWWSK